MLARDYSQPDPGGDDDDNDSDDSMSTDSSFVGSVNSDGAVIFQPCFLLSKEPGKGQEGQEEKPEEEWGKGGTCACISFCLGPSDGLSF